MLLFIHLPLFCSTYSCFSTWITTITYDVVLFLDFSLDLCPSVPSAPKLDFLNEHPSFLVIHKLFQWLHSPLRMKSKLFKMSLKIHDLGFAYFSILISSYLWSFKLHVYTNQKYLVYTNQKYFFFLSIPCLFFITSFCMCYLLRGVFLLSYFYWLAPKMSVLKHHFLSTY